MALNTWIFHFTVVLAFVQNNFIRLAVAMQSTQSIENFCLIIIRIRK